MLTIHLKPSKLLVVILIAAHCAAALLLGLLSVIPEVKLAGMLVLLASLYFYLKRDALQRSAHSAVLLGFSGIRCALETKCGQMFEYAISGETYVSPYLTVLILRSQRSWLTQSIVILPDTISSEEFRRLRVFLRWKWKQVVEEDA
ncbi:protein YgfX [Nitrosomonas sp. Nm51]|uniref:protein YgfX n=1 Tax=Nitrosomonas sp. Nm51 TaxID=133720 RepID=UPI0015A61171|nr:protein YgfX [Nitrosomonas sp. Nm51]